MLDICLQEEEVTDFFIVIEGSCLLNERQIHHLEGRTGTEGFKRVVDCRRGRGFGHYPLIFGEAKYDYSATVVEKTGCCVLLVPKSDYVHVLRKEVEKQMKDTVALLKANKTFSDWSLYALNRFYFWFTRRRYAHGEDIVKQGDPADFCFVIRSGACDVLVQQQDDKPAEKGQQPPPSAAMAALQERRELSNAPIPMAPRRRLSESAPADAAHPAGDEHLDAVVGAEMVGHWQRVGDDV